MHSDLQSAEVSASSSRYLFWVRISAKQQSLHPPEGNLGKSRISLPSTIASQWVCNSTSWSGGDEASWHTRRLPSAVRSRNLFFHCLKINPPGVKKKKKKKKKGVMPSETFLIISHYQRLIDNIKRGDSGHDWWSSVPLD